MPRPAAIVRPDGHRACADLAVFEAATSKISMLSGGAIGAPQRAPSTASTSSTRSRPTSSWSRGRRAAFAPLKVRPASLSASARLPELDPHRAACSGELRCRSRPSIPRRATAAAGWSIGVSFRVDAGEVVGLLGPNGAGKTTSFNMAVGLVRPEAGSVKVGGQDLGDAPMHVRARAGLGYLPQEASVFRRLSVEDNLLAVLELQKSLSRQAQRDSGPGPAHRVRFSARSATSSRAVSAGAWRSRAVWRWTRASCSSMSPSPAWIPSRWPSCRA